jgi:hypothetical protein
MLGLTGRIWKDSYKNIIVIGGDSWSGVPTTYTKLTDGAGGVLPMSVSADGLMIPTGNKLVIGNSPGVRIENTITDQMHILATGKVNIVANKTVINGALSMVGGFFASGIEADVVTARSGAFDEVVLAGTVSATVIKTTGTITAGTINATTIKGKIDFSEATSKEINMSGGVIVLGSGNKISYNANGQDFYVASNKVLGIVGDGFHPNTNEAVDLGRSNTRFRNIYAATAILKNMIASNVNIKGGTVAVSSVIAAIGVNAPTLTATTGFVTDGGKFYLDKEKTMHISKNGNNILLTCSGGSFEITPKSTLIPNADAEGSIGQLGKRFSAAYIANIFAGAISSTGAVRHHNASLFMYNLPTASEGLASGQIYSLNKVIMVKA